MYCIENGKEPGYHRIGSVHAVIWQAGTNWPGSVRIQIYCGPEVHALKKYLSVFYVFTNQIVLLDTQQITTLVKWDCLRYTIAASHNNWTF